MYKFKENGKIGHNKFTLFLGSATGWIEFGIQGVYDEFLHAKMPVQTATWALNIQSTNIGSIKSSGVVFNSGYTVSYMPASDMVILKDYLNT